VFWNLDRLITFQLNNNKNLATEIYNSLNLFTNLIFPNTKIPEHFHIIYNEPLFYDFDADL
jgi:hypothetical protein